MTSSRMGFLVSLIATVCEAAGSTAPENSVRLPRAGIDAFLGGVAAESETLVPKVPLPDSSSTIGGVSVEIKEMRINSFDRPKFTYTLPGQTTLLVKVELPRFVAKAPVRTERKTMVSTQKDAGDLAMTFTGTVVELSVVPRKFENGVMTVDLVDCKPTLGQANLNLQNFRETFSRDAVTLNAKALRPMFSSQLCSMTEKMLTSPANRTLADLPVVFGLNKEPSNGQITLALTQEELKVALQPPAASAPSSK